MYVNLDEYYVSHNTKERPETLAVNLFALFRIGFIPNELLRL